LGEIGYNGDKYKWDITKVCLRRDRRTRRLTAGGLGCDIDNEKGSAPANKGKRRLVNERIVVDILKDSVDANPGSRGTPSRWVAGSRTDRQTDRPTMPTSISGCKYVHWLYLSSFLVGTLSSATGPRVCDDVPSHSIAHLF